MKKKLRELVEIEELKSFKDDLVRWEKLATVNYEDEQYPIDAIHVGSEDIETPVFLLVGGVHGLEKIGTHVIISYLQSLFNRLKWDKTLRASFQYKRICAIPLLNPVGMSHFMRSNGNGIDLMRNAPIESREEFNIPLVAGHRISNKLPWYRGDAENSKLEIESKALVKFVKKYLHPAQVSIALDLHSGFGIKDRLWYPYATSTEKYPLYRETRNMLDLFESTYPHHIYIIEQQSDSYTVNGDLWDYLFEMYYEKNPFKEKVFVPLCLEMGSWSWLKKNPKQILSPLGLFNPIKKHRYNRTMRRHLYLLNYLSKIIENKESWCA